MKKDMRCMAIDDEPMALSVISSFCERKGGISLSVFTDPDEALSNLDSISPELVFLDIEIDGTSGIDVAKRLPESCAVIFTTAYAQYALDGYDLGVVDFLHKPFSYSRFEKAVEKAAMTLEFLHTKNTDKVITVKEDYLNVPVPVSDIIYIEAMNNYCRIYRTGGVVTHTRSTLKSLVDILPGKDFVQIHRSFVVAADKIAGFTKKEVCLLNGKSLPVGRQYADYLSV